MSGEISVVGWEAANTIAKHLVDAGYEVKVTSDGEKIHQTEVGGPYQLAYTVTFAHPTYDNSYFELVEEEYEGLRTWEDIKQELKTGETLPADLAEGLEHLDDKPVWTVSRSDVEETKKAKKKKVKK
jgi:hypothetical protein